VDTSTEEGADGQHDRGRFEDDARHRDHPAHPVTLDDEIRHLLLKEPEVRLALEAAADGLTVELPVGLGPGCPHRGSLARVQRTELDPGRVCGTGHGAAERIDLPHQVSLADTADGRVAAHLPERFDVLSQEQRARTHASGRQRRLGAGMTAADDDDIARCGGL